MAPLKPYTSRDVAALFGRTGKHAADYVTRNLDRLIAAGFPRPLLPFGYYKFDRASVDAWFARYHPSAPKYAVPANDTIASPPLAQQSDDAQRAFLHRTYAPAE